MIASFLFVGCNEPPVPEENTGSGTTQQGGSQEKPNGGTSGGGNSNIPASATVTDILLSKAPDYSDETPKLVAKAKYDDSSEKDVTSDATWKSSDVSVATVSAGEISILSTGTTEITATYSNVESGKATITVTENVSSGDCLVVYMLFNYDQVKNNNGHLYAWKGDVKPYGAWPGTQMQDLTSDEKAYYFIIEDVSVIEKLIINGNGNKTDDMPIPATSGHWLCWHNGSSWGWKEYDGKKVELPSSDSTYSVNVSISNTNNYVDSGNPGGSSTVTLSDDWNNLRIYQVMVSSFQDGDSSRGYQYAYGPNNALKGGDLQGIINAADYIENLGCNAIWMTPIFNSNGNGHLDSTGYFTYDYFNVDPKFGTNETFRKLVETYHEKGIYVILDGVFGHWGANVAASPTGKKPTRSNGQDKACDYPASLEFFKEVATYWIKEYKIDGWRLDQCYQVALGENAKGTIDDNTATNGHNYWYEIRGAVEQAAAENKAKGEQWGTLGYMVGEHWRGDAETIQKGSIDPGPNGIGYGLKSCFDFPSRYRLIQVIAREEGSNSSTDFGSALSYTYGTSTAKGYKHPDGYWPNLFITNHDLVRLGNLINWKFGETPSSDNFYKRHNVAMAVLAAYSGPITIYYGDEWGAYVDGYTGEGALGAYNDNAARSTGKISGFTTKEKSCLDYSSALMKMRSENPALWNGTNETLKSTTSYYVGKKTLGSEEVIYIINNGTSAVSYSCSGIDLISGAKVSDSVTCDGLSARFIKVK